MGLLTMIHEGMDQYTVTERKIAEYVIENSQQVLKYSVNDLARHSGVSTAAVIRFSKRVGFEGYSDLKLELAKDTAVIKEDLKDALSEEDTLQVMAGKAETYYLQNINKTFRLLNFSVLDKVIEILKQATNIYLFGIGASGLTCQDFQYKLIRNGKSAFYNVDPHFNLLPTVHVCSEDVALCISYSGERKEILVAAEEIKKRNCKIIAITQFNANSLSRLADYVIPIPKSESEIRLGAFLSRNSELIITDLLYLGMIQKQLGKEEEKNIKYKKIIEKLYH